LKLRRERGDDSRVANTLMLICGVNRVLGFHEEGIRQAREALEIDKQLHFIQGQALSLELLAQLLHGDKQLDAAEEAASQAIDLFSDGLDQFGVCQSHRTLGKICYSKRETEKAIDHFETALRIASPPNWHGPLALNHYDLANLFFKEGMFDKAQASVERAKSHAAINDPYCLACATQLQAMIWYGQGKFEEAKSEALSAADVFKRFGVAKDLEECRAFLRDVEEKCEG